MPDDRFMDMTKTTDARTALRYARLQLRGGKRCLQNGLPATGMSALYDALVFGMHYYIARHEPSMLAEADPWDALGLFQALTRAGVLDSPIMFNRFSLMVERSLWQGSIPLDADALLMEVDEMLTRLGVIPFNENTLEKGNDQEVMYIG